MMNQAFLDYYRCPERFADFDLARSLSEDSGYFRFGHDTICYGRCSSGLRGELAGDGLHDASGDIRIDGSTLRLPFDPTQVINNLRYERYVANSHEGKKGLTAKGILRNTYYLVRPLMPVSVRRHFQRIHLRGWERMPFPDWPVDRTVERIVEKLLVLSLKAQAGDRMPFIWFWPHGLPSCAIITHDVETSSGRDFCSHLMDINDSLAIKTSFQIVPEKRYAVSQSFLNRIRERGFEINIHDLNHDGYLFSDQEEFLRRAKRINQYAREYGASGFRSGAMYRNVDWYNVFEFSYDMSVPNVAHLDPQRGGCCTVMPYFIGKILELPLTTTQDYSLFHILDDYSIELWKRQIELITEKHGLVSFIIHPDYIIEKRARDAYKGLLGYLAQLRSEGKTWIALPGEVDLWWRQRSQMKLVPEGGTWRVEGQGKERARIAYACLEGDRLVYTL